MLKQQLIVVTIVIYSKKTYLILNVQIPIQNFHFNLPNMCKFAHDRKPKKKNYKSLIKKSLKKKKNCPASTQFGPFHPELRLALRVSANEVVEMSGNIRLGDSIFWFEGFSKLWMK